jgi:glycosyltransferase involved in cell wall biosynthesis
MSSKLRVNYISNLDLSQTTGGWTGINVAIYSYLAANFDVDFIGPINPANDFRAKVISKINRLSSYAGNFHFFSERRLKKIAQLVEQEVDINADCDFFHGATPWVLYDSQRPYFLYADTCFSTYMDIYHDRAQFVGKDLNRVYQSEANWLGRAQQVFFGTQWALDRAVVDYQIPGTNFCAVGAGGSMTPPERDTYAGGFHFLFVALDFERKGGRVCVEAVQEVQAQFPDARLTIVGERPPSDVMRLSGISYAGYLRKSIPAELEKLDALYASAFALIHPTSMDIQPLVISEAGYYGCPSIAANSFGIPELIQDGVTGFLIPLPLTAKAFADRMLLMCADKLSYLAMRKAVRSHTVTNQTWNAVGDRIVKHMAEDLRD